MVDTKTYFRLLRHNTLDQMRFGGCEDTKKFLKEGITYEGKKEVHSWYTKIWINGHCFNSVCFEEEFMPSTYLASNRKGDGK